MNPDKIHLLPTSKPPVFLGYLSEDGIGVLPEHGLPAPRYELTTTDSFTTTFTLTKRAARRMAKLITGRYRFPDDKPLIQNGKKPR